MANEKRLTEKHYDGKGYYLKCSEECHLVDLSCEDCVEVQKIVDRLGEYEDKAEQTVDAVEVVRCKDCRWARQKDIREPVETPRELICECFLHHHIPAPWGARLAVNPDDFCSYGERKDK